MRDVRTTVHGLLDRIYDRIPVDERDTFLLKSMYIESTEQVVKELSMYLTDEEIQVFQPKLTDQVCTECGSFEYFKENDCSVCSNCGMVTYSQFGGLTALGYRHTLPHVTRNSYKREGHFSDFLKRIQAQEMTTIPEAALTAIDEFCAKQRIDPKALSYKNIRKALSDNRMSHLFHSIPSILLRYTGARQLAIDRHLQAEMKTLFLEIQEPFEIAVQQVCPERKNFISYGFVTTRLMELVGINPAPFHLNGPKTWEKQIEQDRIWKSICEQCEFPFTPTV